MINVLYVDDEVINLELFSITYHSVFNVTKAASGDDALKILDNQPIDIVITDLKMPGMDGIELIYQIRKKYPEKKCILLTGFYESGLKEHPDIKDIVHSYVSKPFNKEELKKMIMSASC
jgi:YesN/AraC family two-component response regulator